MDPRSRTTRYLLTLIIMSLATMLGLGLAGLEVGTPYLTLFPAIVLCWLLGGFGPGLWAAVLGVTSSWYFFTPPLWTFEIPSYSDGLALLLYLLVIGFVCSVLHWQRRDISRLKATGKDLWRFTALVEEGFDQRTRELERANRRLEAEITSRR